MKKLAVGRRVALLRAVNLGGKTKLAMADLRELAGALGLLEPQTILQTGNLVFFSKEPVEALEARIGSGLAERLGLATDVMVRDVVEWAAMVDANPFVDAARVDPAHLLLFALKGDPVPGAQAALDAAIKGRERAHVTGRATYAVFPDGIGRSKLTPQVLERNLGTRVTGRNWNTVLKIAAALGPFAG